MNQPQHTKNFLGSGAGLLSLCLGAAVLFFTLKPGTESLQGISTEVSQPQKIVKAPAPKPVSEPRPTFSEVPAEAERHPAASAAAVVPVAESDEDSENRVEVIEPGKIRLTEEQTNTLKGRGSSWGQPNPEAEAVLRSIPKEAFTSDW